MEKEKNKRDYLPDLRKLYKDLEDAIIEKDDDGVNEAIVQLEIIVRKIRRSEYAED